VKGISNEMGELCKRRGIDSNGVSCGEGHKQKMWELCERRGIDYNGVSCGEGHKQWNGGA